MIGLSMNALSKLLERLSFAALCIVAWGIFPVLIAVGGAALLIYATMAELCSWVGADPAPPAMDDLTARRTASRLCGTLQP
jgi:hypothetical protein